tara:strand:- start:1016 stop:1438 length:423 start_codon:yes stop_codon:yes gene_type:complete
MKIQKVLKFVGDPNGLRVVRKTIQSLAAVLEDGAEDLHALCGAINPNRNVGIAVASVLFPRATARAAMVEKDMSAFYEKLFPRRQLYLAEVISVKDETATCRIESLTPEVTFTLETSHLVLGDCFPATFCAEAGEWKEER